AVDAAEALDRARDDLPRRVRGGHVAVKRHRLGAEREELLHDGVEAGRGRDVHRGDPRRRALRLAVSREPETRRPTDSAARSGHQHPHDVTSAREVYAITAWLAGASGRAGRGRPFRIPWPRSVCPTVGPAGRDTRAAKG